MKLNQSLTVRTAGTMAANPSAQRITGVPAMYRTLFALVAVVIATVVGIGLWNAARPAAPAVPAAGSQTLSPEDVATLPWQIQKQVAGVDGVATSMVAPSSHELRPEYIVTLPHQIQAQVAGQGTLPAHAATRLTPEDVRTLPWQIQEQVH